MRRLLCSAAAVAACVWLSGGVASANTCAGICAQGFLNTNPNGSFFDDNIANGKSISDRWDFTLVSPPSADKETINEITIQPGSIDGLTLALYTSGGSFITSNNTPIFDTTGEHISLTDTLAASGLGTGYYFLISGTADAAVGSSTVSYSGNISTTAGSLQGTPLPGTLALFAGGLGLLGFAGMRRRSKAAPGMRLTAS